MILHKFTGIPLITDLEINQICFVKTSKTIYWQKSQTVLSNALPFATNPNLMEILDNIYSEQENADLIQKQKDYNSVVSNIKNYNLEHFKVEEKVDKEIGKSLSKNDFTDVLKNKLDALPNDFSVIKNQINSIIAIVGDGNPDADLIIPHLLK